MDKLTYTLGKKGFRKGRGTITCLENEIKKAQLHKRVVAVFLDIDKAYDMMWREGLLLN